MRQFNITFLIAIFVIFNSVAQDITEKFKYESKFKKIGNDAIHYIDVGSGDPILFLHGIPMSSYSWRNIIPHLSDSTRCIAIDFMGFGKSDKPKIAYTFTNQLDYLTAFIEELNLANITLVMTDIGGIIGTSYAMNNPGKIKGLVFMESSLSDAQTFHKNGGFMQHMMFWMSRKPKMGYNKIVKKNLFLKMMPKLIKRKLTKYEKEYYRKPFTTVESRIPIYALAHSFPKKGKNAQQGDMAYFLNKNAVELQKSNIPKLLIYAKPGMLVNKKVLKWAKEKLINLETQYVGKAKHLMEEDLPHEIGSTIRNWYAKRIKK